MRQIFPRSVFEIENLPEDAELTLLAGSETCRIRTLPPKERELRLLVASCFWQDGDRGNLRSGASLLRPIFEKPHLRILCGDQIYMDVPGFGLLFAGSNAKDGTVDRYRRYWGDAGYSAFLGDGLTLFTPDDHEFWNDFPHRPFWLSRTWTAQSRAAHERYARAGFLAHQALANPGARSWFSLDLGPVSLFVTDTRTERDAAGSPGARLFGDAQERALLAWSAALAKPGILVLGPPLFQRAASKVLWLETDHNLLSYPREAALIWRAVEEAPRDVLVLAGDIHMSRLTEWAAPSGRVLREIVASPMSVIHGKNDGDVEPPPLDLRPEGDASPRRSRIMKYATRKNGFTLIYVIPGNGGVLVRVQAREVPSARIAASDWGAPGRSCAHEFTLR